MKTLCEGRDVRRKSVEHRLNAADSAADVVPSSHSAAERTHLRAVTWLLGFVPSLRSVPLSGVITLTQPCDLLHLSV